MAWLLLQSRWRYAVAVAVLLLGALVAGAFPRRRPALLLDRLEPASSGGPGIAVFQLVNLGPVPIQCRVWHQGRESALRSLVQLSDNGEWGQAFSGEEDASYCETTVSLEELAAGAPRELWIKIPDVTGRFRVGVLYNVEPTGIQSKLSSLQGWLHRRGVRVFQGWNPIICVVWSESVGEDLAPGQHHSWGTPGERLLQGLQRKVELSRIPARPEVP